MGFLDPLFSDDMDPVEVVSAARVASSSSEIPSKASWDALEPSEDVEERFGFSGFGRGVGAGPLSAGGEVAAECGGENIVFALRRPSFERGGFGGGRHELGGLRATTAGLGADAVDAMEEISLSLWHFFFACRPGQTLD